MCGRLQFIYKSLQFNFREDFQIFDYLKELRNHVSLNEQKYSNRTNLKLETKPKKNQKGIGRAES